MPSKINKLYKIKVLLFSIFSILKVNLVGQVGGGEIIAIIDSLSIKRWINTFKKLPDVKKVNYAYLFFLFSQVLSDIFNNSSFNNLIRGWANIIVAMVLITFISRYLYKNSVFIITILFGQVLSVFIFKFGQFADFKFFWAPIFNNLVLIYSWYLLKKRSKNKFVLLLLVIYGLLSIAFDYRSNGIFMIFTGILFYYQKVLLNFRFIKILPVMILFLAVGQGLYTIYVSKILSREIRNDRSYMQLNKLENPYNPFILLMEGRAEVFVALEAIADNPILGYGSWAPDPGGKYNYLLYKLHGDSEKFDVKYDENEDNFIPSHSVLFGAYLTAGLGGFLAMIYIFILFLKRVIKILSQPSFLTYRYSPIVLFFAFSGIWNFIFSPLGHIRQTIPIFLGLILVLYEKEKLNKKKI